MASKMSPDLRALIQNYHADSFHHEGLTAEGIQAVKAKIREAQNLLSAGKPLSPDLQEWCGMFRQQYLAFNGSTNRSSRPRKREVDPTPASDTNSDPPSKKRASDPALAPHDKGNRASEMGNVAALIQTIRNEDLAEGPVSPEKLAEFKNQVSATTKYESLSLETTKPIFDLLAHVDFRACAFLRIINPLSVRPSGPPTEDVVPHLEKARSFLPEAQQLASESGTCGKLLKEVIAVMHTFEGKQIHFSPNELTADYDAKITSLLSTFSAHSGSAPSPLQRQRLSFYVHKNPGLLDVLVSMMTPSA